MTSIRLFDKPTPRMRFVAKIAFDQQNIIHDRNFTCYSHFYHSLLAKKLPRKYCVFHRSHIRSSRRALSITNRIQNELHNMKISTINFP